MVLSLLSDLAVSLRILALAFGLLTYASHPLSFLYLFEVVCFANLLAITLRATPRSRFARVFHLVFGKFESTFLLCVVCALSPGDIRLYVLFAVAQYLSLWISVYRYSLPSKLLTKEAHDLVYSAKPFPVSLVHEIAWFLADVHPT